MIFQQPTQPTRPKHINTTVVRKLRITSGSTDTFENIRLVLKPYDIVTWHVIYYREAHAANVRALTRLIEMVRTCSAWVSHALNVPSDLSSTSSLYYNSATQDISDTHAAVTLRYTMLTSSHLLPLEFPWSRQNCRSFLNPWNSCSNLGLSPGWSNPSKSQPLMFRAPSCKRAASPNAVRWRPPTNVKCG